MSESQLPADRPDVSVIVVNWNTRDLLHDCLTSVARQTRCTHEVIVVDNASADGSAEMVARDHPQVQLVASAENLGFALGNNVALERARGRYLLLLNPDTVILDGAIDKALAQMEANPDIGGLGVQVWENEHTIQPTCFADMTPLNLFLNEFGFKSLFRRSAFFQRPRYGLWDRRSARDVDVVSGMFLMVPRAVLETVGPLDPDYFVYVEEADWCLRIRRAGWRCHFYPEARIIHRDGGKKSTSQIRARMHVQLQKSKMRYMRLHFGARGWLVGWLVMTGNAAFRATAFTALLPFGNRVERRARVRLALVSLRHHLTGWMPAA